MSAGKVYLLPSQMHLAKYFGQGWEIIETEPLPMMKASRSKQKPKPKSYWKSQIKKANAILKQAGAK